METAIQLDKEPAIMVREPGATMQPTPQNNQLMSKHRVLSLKPQLRLEWRGQDGQNETEQPDVRQLRRFHYVINSDKVFGTHRLQNAEQRFYTAWVIFGLWRGPERRPLDPDEQTSLSESIRSEKCQKATWSRVYE